MRLTTDTPDVSSLSALESINVDVLLLILSAANSLDDLSALIHASPTLYRTFLSAKASILLKVGAADLGPVFNDAAILAYTEMEPFKSIPSEVYYDRVEETVASWRKRLVSGKTRWAPGISEETAVCIVRANRTVQYFVRLYALTRFTYFERNLVSTECTWSLTVPERRHLSRAFMRCQIILNMYCAPNPPPLDKGFLITRVLGLFEPWEKEQISQADCFVSTVCWAVLSCEDKVKGRHHTPIDMDTYFNDFYPNLSGLRRKTIESIAVEPKFMDRLVHPPDISRISSGKLGRGSRYMFLNASLPRELYDYYSTDRPPAPSVPCNIVSQAKTEPPWAWIEATNGGFWDRWGLDLLPPTLPTYSFSVWIEAQRRLVLWRWTGFAFWDRDRVMAVKKAGLLGELNVGWVVNTWE